MTIWSPAFSVEASVTSVAFGVAANTAVGSSDSSITSASSTDSRRLLSPLFFKI